MTMMPEPLLVPFRSEGRPGRPTAWTPCGEIISTAVRPGDADAGSVMADRRGDGKPVPYAASRAHRLLRTWSPAVRRVEGGIKSGPAPTGSCTERASRFHYTKGNGKLDLLPAFSLPPCTRTAPAARDVNRLVLRIARKWCDPGPDLAAGMRLTWQEKLARSAKFHGQIVIPTNDRRCRHGTCWSGSGALSTFEQVHCARASWADRSRFEGGAA